MQNTTGTLSIPYINTGHKAETIIVVLIIYRDNVFFNNLVNL